jgi:hypothetical protein
MKFRIQLKDPDGFFDGVADAVDESMKSVDLHEDERDAVREQRRERVNSALEKWVEYSEYVTLEFDTDAGTAAVVALRP